MNFCRNSLTIIFFFGIYLTMKFSDERLCSFTSIGVGGKCKGIFLPENQSEFINLLRFLDFQEEDYKVIGNGTNLLFSDNFHNFYVISTRKIAKKMSKRNNCATFSCSTTLFEAYNFCLKQSLSGFEKLAGVPGNIGGAIASGASCFGQSIFDYLESITIYHEGKIKKLKNFDKGYHTSFFLKNKLKSPYIILSAKFCLNFSQACEVQKSYLECISKRRLSQPCGKSFGCIFKNKNGESSGKLIEKCGLKGLQKNDAFISDKHANFIINKNKASFNDIKYLIDKIEHTLKEKYNITLEKDVEIIK